MWGPGNAKSVLCLWQEAATGRSGCEIMSFSGCGGFWHTWGCHLVPRHCFDVGVKVPLHEHLQSISPEIPIIYFCAWQQKLCGGRVATGVSLFPPLLQPSCQDFNFLNFRGLRTALPDGDCHLCIMIKELWLHQHDVIFGISLKTLYAGS